MPPITCTSFLDFVKEAVWENSPKPCLKSPGLRFSPFWLWALCKQPESPRGFALLRRTSPVCRRSGPFPPFKQGRKNGTCIQQHKRRTHFSRRFSHPLGIFPYFRAAEASPALRAHRPIPCFSRPFFRSIKNTRGVLSRVDAARWAPPPSKRSPPEAPRGNSPTPVRPSLSFIVTSPWETVKRPLVPPASSIPQRGLSIPQRGNHPPVPKAPLPLAKENFSWHGLGY